MDRFVSLLTHWVWNGTSFAKRPYNFKRKKKAHYKAITAQNKKVKHWDKDKIRSSTVLKFLHNSYSSCREISQRQHGGEHILLNELFYADI